MDISIQTATACLPRQAGSVPFTVRGTTVFTRVYAGQASQCAAVRAAVHAVLPSFPAADDAALVASELAANACLHSRSGLPGGHFALTVHDCPGDRVRVAVTDQGSDWDGDLGAVTGWPHGLYLLEQVAQAREVTGSSDGWTVWAAITYPAEPAPAATA